MPKLVLAKSGPLHHLLQPKTVPGGPFLAMSGCQKWFHPAKTGPSWDISGSQNWSGGTNFGNQKWSHQTSFGCQIWSPNQIEGIS